MKKIVVIFAVLLMVGAGLATVPANAQAPDPSISFVSLDAFGCNSSDTDITWSYTSSVEVAGYVFTETVVNGLLYMDEYFDFTYSAGGDTAPWSFYNNNNRGIQQATYPTPAGVPVTLRVGIVDPTETQVTHMLEVVLDGCDTGNVQSVTYCSLPYTGGPTSCSDARTGYPNNGEFSISTSAPVMAYDSAGGDPVRLASGSELFLPNDADGNGFDTYIITATAEVGGETWYSFFIGDLYTYVWVRADDVTRTR